MQPVTMYTKMMCPFCMRAKSLLTKKGANVVDIPAAFDAGKRKEMIQRSHGARTYPQIFIGDIHVGGFDELNALEKAGKLDALLAG